MNNVKLLVVRQRSNQAIANPFPLKLQRLYFYRNISFIFLCLLSFLREQYESLLCCCCFLAFVLNCRLGIPNDSHLSFCSASLSFSFLSVYMCECHFYLYACSMITIPFSITIPEYTRCHISIHFYI